MNMILKSIVLIVASVVIASCQNSNLNGGEAVPQHPLVGKWDLTKGKRPFGQSQFQADEYFQRLEFYHDGSLYIKRDDGTETSGTWVYHEGDEMLILRYKGGHDGAGFTAQRNLAVLSQIKLDGDTLTFPDLGSQEMTYSKSLKKD